MVKKSKPSPRKQTTVRLRPAVLKALKSEAQEQSKKLGFRVTPSNLIESMLTNELETRGYVIASDAN